MHLTHISINNFRNLESLTVDLRSGLNVLVGPNNAGKTNLFDAIRHALGPSASRSEPLWLEEKDLFREPDTDCPGGAPSSGSADKGSDRPGTTYRSAPAINISLVFTELDEDDAALFFEILHFSPQSSVEDAPAQINFEATWNPDTRRFRIERWGGDPDGDRTPIPSEILDALPLIFLPALRDAEAALTPGSRSILARVLDDLATRDTTIEHKSRLEEIFGEANRQLEGEALIQKVQKRLQQGTAQMAGADYTLTSIRAAPPDFRRILRTLQLLLNDAPVQELSSSGLGYNNLLYISAILAHLEDPSGPECPVLLVEEPEAHLSPQLTVLLAEYLSKLALPQILVSTHSPTFAANVKPSQVLILGRQADRPACAALHKAEMNDREERQLQRMLDVTRATLYFSKGLILVEGISEALLIPVLARLLEKDLAKHHISVLPICGVSFTTFQKIFSPNLATIPVSILTDSDPPLRSPDPTDGKAHWKVEEPIAGKKSDRLKSLEDLFAQNPHVLISASTVTLEYDLALASCFNAEHMARIWESAFDGTPRNLREDQVKSLATTQAKALHVWRAICRASSTGSKADFANLLADSLQSIPEDSDIAFQVPKYILDAIEHVLPSSAPSSS